MANSSSVMCPLSFRVPCLAICALGALAAAAGPAAQVQRTDSAPTVDGRLDEPCWRAAAWTGDFVRFASEKGKRPIAAQTEFALVADARTLYVGIRAHEPERDAFRTQAERSLWVSDDIELFFAPTGSGFDYYQFAIGAKASSGEATLFFSEGGNIQPDPYRPDYRVGRGEFEDGWTLEIAIPLASFYMTRNALWKEEWIFNVFRQRVTGAHEQSTWSPLNRDPNELGRMRRVGGFPQRRAEDDVLLNEAKATVSGRKDGRLVGTLSLDVQVAREGRYRMEGKAFDLAAGRKTRVTVPMTFEKTGRNLVRLELVREATGERYGRLYPVDIDFEEIRARLTKPEYRDNFYPGQDADEVCGTVATVGDGPVTVSIEGPGFAAQTKTLPQGGGAFAFDTKGFAEGTARLAIRCGASEKTLKVRKLAPTGHRMAWISGGHLVVDGKPVFRRNMYARGYHGGHALDAAWAADRNRHDTPLVTSCGSIEVDRTMSPAYEHKYATKDEPPMRDYLDKLAARVAAAKDKDFVYWYVADEPECRGLSPVYHRYVYEYMKEIDPYHPLLMASRSAGRYVDCCDWFETHPYLNPHDDGSGNRKYGVAPSEIGTYVDAISSLGRSDKCIGQIPTCFAYRFKTVENDYPTFDEYVCSIWTAIAHGAATLYPYAYHDYGDRAALFEGTRYVYESVEALEDLLLGGRRRLLVRDLEKECALFETAEEKMFVLVNFTGKELAVQLPPELGGANFREFRGERTFNLQPPTCTLAPFETIVATTRKRDAGLTSRAETVAKINALEYERTHRDNQILEKYEEIEFSSSTASRAFYKLIDGIRNVYAWEQNWSALPYVEFAFPRKPIAFSKVRVYGYGIDGMNVQIRKGGEWKSLVPVRVKTEEWMRELDFGSVETTIRMRIAFSDGKKSVKTVELYEIEIPHVADGALPATAAGASTSAAAEAPVKALWTFDGSNAEWIPAGYSTTKWHGGKTQTVRPNGRGGFVVSGTACHGVRYDPAYPWLECRVNSAVTNFKGNGGPYHAWWIRVGASGAPSVCHALGIPPPGLYTVRLPAEKPKHEFLTIEDHNLDLDIAYLRAVGKPANCLSAEVVGGGAVAKKGDTVVVTLELAAPCEDVSANLLQVRGEGYKGYLLNGSGTLEMKAVDGTGRVWKAEVVLASCAPAQSRQVYVKCQPLGGPLIVPLYTNFTCAFAGK